MIVIPVGQTVYDFHTISKVLEKLSIKMRNHKTQLGKLTSIWLSEDEESCIRNSNNRHHIHQSFIIGVKCKIMLILAGNSISVSTIDIDDESNLTVAFCTASVATWQTTIIKLINHKTTNELGTILLGEFDKLGYSGVFSQYKRSRENNQMRLEYRP